MNSNNIVVFGVGRVGLPLALVLADLGYDVWGIDIDPARIALLNNKKLPFLEEGADKLLKKYGGKSFNVFPAQSMEEAVARSKYIIITLGTPIDETYSPDHSQIEGLFTELVPLFKKGHVVILRSTISPGTTKQLARFIEENSQFTVGKDIFLAYCPERIAEGKSVQELKGIPQIIGVLDKESLKAAAKIFSKITKKILSAKPKSVELAKLFCNMYRYIDFAIGNEFMTIAEDYGSDYYEVLNLVNTDYKRGGLKSPGLTAGPCLVKDGFFLIDKSPYIDLVMAAWRLNENIPGYLFKRIKSEIKTLNRKKVAILGVSFKKNIDDKRFSLVPKIQRYFEVEGAQVLVNDPFISSEPLKKTISKADILIIGTNHDVYKKLTLENLKKQVSRDCLICDIWNLFGTGKIIFRINKLQ